MNLDMAIRNALKQGVLSNAMHSLNSEYGRSFELHSIPLDIKKAETLTQQKLIKAAHPLAERGSTIPWSNRVSFVDNILPQASVVESLRGGL